MPDAPDAPDLRPDTASDSAEQLNWLTAAEEQVWRRWLAVTGRIPARLSQALQADSQLSLQDYDVLVTLSDRETHCCRITELAGLLEWERSRMSHHLTRMEKRGLITRGSSPEDGRAQLAHLTPLGRQALEAAAPTHLRSVRESFFDALDAQDLEDLDRITGKLTQNLALREIACEGTPESKRPASR